MSWHLSFNRRIDPLFKPPASSLSALVCPAFPCRVLLALLQVSDVIAPNQRREFIIIRDNYRDNEIHLSLKRIEVGINYRSAMLVTKDVGRNAVRQMSSLYAKYFQHLCLHTYGDGERDESPS